MHRSSPLSDRVDNSISRHEATSGFAHATTRRFAQFPFGTFVKELGCFRLPFTPPSSYVGELPNSHGWTLTSRSYVLHGMPDKSKEIANRNYCGLSKVIRTDVLFSGHGLLSADSAKFLKITVKLILFRYCIDLDQCLKCCRHCTGKFTKPFFINLYYFFCPKQVRYDTICNKTKVCIVSPNC